MARNNPLADPQFAKSVAEALAAGLSRRQMAAQFGVKDLDTISRWRRDPRVKTQVFKIMEDRILQITRKVDGVLAERLEHANEMSVKELLEIRKEFLGGALRAQTEKADEETVAEAASFLERNPKAMEMLEAMLNGTNEFPGAIEDEKIEA